MIRFSCVLVLTVFFVTAVVPAARAGPDVPVREYQSLLKETGYYRGPLDGIRGPLTEEAVIRFQRDHGLVADGVVGPATLAALRRAAATYVVRKGDTLAAIAARYGVTVKWLCQVNRIRDADLIRPGQKLIVREVKAAGTTGQSRTGSGQNTTRESPGQRTTQPQAERAAAEKDTVSGKDEGPAWQTFLPGAAAAPPRLGLQGARVALTFNDAPHRNTDSVLDVLARHGAKATFFLIGERVVPSRAQVRRMVTEGHQLGNHSYSHHVLVGQALADVEKDISAAQAAIAAAAGQEPGYFRPPGGAMDRTVATAAARQGLTTVLWHNVGATDDLPLPPEELARRIASRCREGYIVMLHADRPQTAAVVDHLIRLLTGAGARLVTLAELGAP